MPSVVTTVAFPRIVGIISRCPLCAQKGEATIVWPTCATDLSAAMMETMCKFLWCTPGPSRRVAPITPELEHKRRAVNVVEALNKRWVENSRCSTHLDLQHARCTLAIHLLLHNRPKNHPKDKCGACKKPMPWRQEGEAHHHSCHGCRNPLHGSATKDCPVIQVEVADGMPLLYCSTNCARKKEPAEAAKKKRARGAGTKYL